MTAPGREQNCSVEAFLLRQIEKAELTELVLKDEEVFEGSGRGSINAERYPSNGNATQKAR